MKKIHLFFIALITGIVTGVCFGVLYTQFGIGRQPVALNTKIAGQTIKQISIVVPQTSETHKVDKTLEVATSSQIKIPDQVSLFFVGDMMFDRNVATRSHKAKSLAYPLAHVHDQKEFFRGMDAVIGNLEGPVTDKRTLPDKGDVDFMFDPQIPFILKAAGFTAVSQANNHTYDQALAGAQVSKSNISKAGLISFGDQAKDDETDALSIIQSRGHKIALLGYDAYSHTPNKDEIARTIADARTKADYVVVYMHWGIEYQAKPNQKQIDLAHWLIDNGVDAVIGSHPHWMQSVEVYHGHPIAYSLGNFVFDQDFSAETDYGLTVELILNKQGSELHLFPVKITRSQPELLTGQERTDRLQHLASISDASLTTQIMQGVINIKK